MKLRALFGILITSMVFMLTGCAQKASIPVVTPPTAPPAAAPVKAEVNQVLGVPVLMYHSISQEKNNDAVISPENFAGQMEYLYKMGYNPISLDQLYDYLNGKQVLPAKPVVITFDDGYRDTYEIAFPLLKRYGFKSTLFIITADAERRLSWKELAEMKAAGMEIGSHSYTHRELAGLSATEQAEEIIKSKQTLDQNLKQDTRYFCFPNSSYNQETLRILREKGFKLAITTEPGWAKPASNPLALKRVWIGNGVDIKRFEERLTREDYKIL